MQDETVGDGWYKVTFRQEGESEYHKVLWGRLGYGNWDRVVDRLACGDTFEPAICMTITEHDALRATIATQAAELERLTRKEQGRIREVHEVEQTLGVALGYPWYCDDQVNFPGATTEWGVCVGELTVATLAIEVAQRIATQAARIKQLDREADALATTFREVVADLEAHAAELDRLRAELAEATGQLLTWHYDTKHEWGFPLSEEVWEKNPLRQRYKDLTGADWVEPVEKDVDDDAPTQAHEEDV